MLLSNSVCVRAHIDNFIVVLNGEFMTHQVMMIGSDHFNAFNGITFSFLLFCFAARQSLNVHTLFNHSHTVVRLTQRKIVAKFEANGVQNEISIIFLHLV